MSFLVGVVYWISLARFFVTPWTVALQAPLSMEFSRQEDWRGLPFPSPGDSPNPGIKPRSPALAGRFLTTESPGKPSMSIHVVANGIISLCFYSWVVFHCTYISHLFYPFICRVTLRLLLRLGYYEHWGAHIFWIIVWAWVASLSPQWHRASQSSSCVGGSLEKVGSSVEGLSLVLACTMPSPSTPLPL